MAWRTQRRHSIPALLRGWAPAAPLLLLTALCTALTLPNATAQDAAAGERVFAQCRACHQIGPNARNAVGPVLNGLFRRKTGMVEGYQYSAANKAADITWTDETFAEYIRAPREKIPRHPRWSSPASRTSRRSRISPPICTASTTLPSR